MSKLNSDQLNKKNQKSTAPGLADGVSWKTDVYGVIDDLFLDDSTEKVIELKNKYFGYAVVKFLSDMNLTFLDSDENEPRIALSLEDGTFKFISHLEDRVSYEIPYEWDMFVKETKQYISDNPISKKVQMDNPLKKMDNWNVPLNEQKDEDIFDVAKDSISKGITNVKDWVKEMKEKFDLSVDQAKDKADEYVEKLYHETNKTIYTAKGNLDIKLSSGIYINMEDLVTSNGWAEQFKKDYGSSIRKYLVDSTDENVERNLLNEIGFRHIKDEIIIKENKFWNNRIIEVKFEGQDDVEIEYIDKSEFSENDNPNDDSNENVDVTYSKEDIVDVKDPVNVMDMDNDDTIKKIKHFNDETIFIISNTNYLETPDVMVEDEYVTFSNIGNSNKSIEYMASSFSIVTKREYLNGEKFINEDNVNKIIVIPNMVGDITLSFKDTNNNNLDLDGIDFQKDFIINELMDKYGDSFIGGKLFLNLPNDVDFLEIDIEDIDQYLK